MWSDPVLPFLHKITCECMCTLISHGTVSNLNTFQNSSVMNTLLPTHSVRQKTSFSHYFLKTEQLAVGSTSLVTKTEMLA